MRRMAWMALIVLSGACGETASVDPSCEDSVGFIWVGGLHPDAESGATNGFLGTDVLGEIGFGCVAIGQSCEFWSYSAFGPRGEPGGVVYTGKLSDAQAAEIEGILQLDAWEALGPVHGLCCIFDFAPSSYHWGSNTLAWVGTPNAAGPFERLTMSDGRSFRAPM